MFKIFPLVSVLILLLSLSGCSQKQEGESSSSTTPASPHAISTVMDVVPKENAAPAFAWTDSGGTRVTFEQFRGTLTVINFWATWCGPCKKELPDLVELSKELAPQGVKFLGLSTDTGPGASEKVSGFIDTYGIPYTIVLSNEDLEEAFGNITGLPTTILVGKNGEILKTIIGARSKAQFLEVIKASLL
jgi:thiol-disulfide isomerase/thioredoxin